MRLSSLRYSVPGLGSGLGPHNMKKLRSVTHILKKIRQQKLPMRGPRYCIGSHSFKAAIINVFKELKETTLKEIKEVMMTVSHQIENVNIEIEIIFRSKIETLELKSITEMKNLVEGLNGRFDPVEERVNECEDTIIINVHELNN